MSKLLKNMPVVRGVSLAVALFGAAAAYAGDRPAGCAEKEAEAVEKIEGLIEDFERAHARFKAGEITVEQATSRVAIAARVAKDAHDAISGDVERCQMYEYTNTILRLEGLAGDSKRLLGIN